MSQAMFDNYLTCALCYLRITKNQVHIIKELQKNQVHNKI